MAALSPGMSFRHRLRPDVLREKGDGRCRARGTAELLRRPQGPQRRRLPRAAGLRRPVVRQDRHSLSADSQGKSRRCGGGRGALSATCNAAAEIFQIAAIMDGARPRGGGRHVRPPAGGGVAGGVGVREKFKINCYNIHFLVPRSSEGSKKKAPSMEDSRCDSCRWTLPGGVAQGSELCSIYCELAYNSPLLALSGGAILKNLSPPRCAVDLEKYRKCS